MKNNLIGAQIVVIDEDSLTVKKDGFLHTLKVNSDNGDCCGFAEFSINLLYKENSSRNPIITNVEKLMEETPDGQASVITFYGESKVLANIESLATSGSGCMYGSFVNIECETLDIDEELASW